MLTTFILLVHFAGALTALRAVMEVCIPQGVIAPSRQC